MKTVIAISTDRNFRLVEVVHGRTHRAGDLVLQTEMTWYQVERRNVRRWNVILEEPVRWVAEDFLNNETGLEPFRQIGWSNADNSIDQRDAYASDDECFGAGWDNLNDTLVEFPGWSRMTEEAKARAFYAADTAFHTRLKSRGISWSN